MEQTYDTVLKAALALDHDHKVALAERIAIDLANNDEHLTAWVEESNRRYEAYKRGEIEAVDAKESIAKMRSRIFKK